MMKPWIVIAALLSLALVVPGCSQTPLQQSVQARELYTSTLQSLSTARRAGLIDDAAYVKIEQGRQVAATALDAMETNAVSGDGVKFTFYRNSFNGAIDTLLEWRIKTQKKE
jgi:hypothetical protein